MISRLAMIGGLILQYVQYIANVLYSLYRVYKPMHNKGLIFDGNKRSRALALTAIFLAVKASLKIKKS
ncbi:hypothetical protein BTV98_06620 [Psychrobacter sp. Cmf 22.2]|nr:hypothetical protein BTV98_06620 [Psychrobacter sp. Cmf 22.2]